MLIFRGVSKRQGIGLLWNATERVDLPEVVEPKFGGVPEKHRKKNGVSKPGYEGICFAWLCSII